MDNNYYVIFLGDFPSKPLSEQVDNIQLNWPFTFFSPSLDFSLINYIDSSLSNISIKVIKGWINLKIDNGFERIMKEGDENILPKSHFHKVTTKYEPSMYMYVYTNQSDLEHEIDQDTEVPKRKIIKIAQNWIKR